LDRRQRLTDPGIIGDFYRVLLFLDWHIEIHSNEDAFTMDIDIANRELH
jgi:hypothetical protein